MALLEAQALEAARRADAELARGFWRGPLHCVPVAAKDLLRVEGVATVAGMAGLPHSPAEADATAVGRLRRARWSWPRCS